MNNNWYYHYFHYYVGKTKIKSIHIVKRFTIVGVNKLPSESNKWQKFLLNHTSNLCFHSVFKRYALSFLGGGGGGAGTR